MLGVRARLMSALSFPGERVLLIDPESLDFHPHGDNYLLLWPDLESTNFSDVEGSGRINCQVTDRFNVHVRTRFAVDESASAIKWLTDKALGHIKLRHAVYNALIDFQASDTNGNILNFPIWPVSASRPGRGWRSRHVQQARMREGTFAAGKASPMDKGWGESVATFAVRYALDLDITTLL